MPPLPEFHHRPGDIGIVEVLQKFEPEHPPQTDSHVAVAGKVKVDLKSISRQPQPRPDSRQILGCQGLIPQLANSVGKKDLLRRAHGEAPDAGDEFVQILPPLLQLIRHGFIAYNGTGDELGEQCYIRAKDDGILLHRRVLTVDVDGVAHGLEGIEADADRQRQPQHRQLQPRQSV